MNYIVLYIKRAESNIRYWKAYQKQNKLTMEDVSGLYYIKKLIKCEATEQFLMCMGLTCCPRLRDLKYKGLEINCIVNVLENI